MGSLSRGLISRFVLSMEVLPNVFPSNFQMDGKTLMVKNTFVDVAEPSSPSRSHRRCRSVPHGLLSSAGSEDAFSDAPLMEFRRRIFTCGIDAVDLQSNASTQMPSSMLAGSEVSAGSSGSWPAERASFVESRSSNWRCTSWACATDEPCEDEVA